MVSRMSACVENPMLVSAVPSFLTGRGKSSFRSVLNLNWRKLCGFSLTRILARFRARLFSKLKLGCANLGNLTSEGFMSEKRGPGRPAKPDTSRLSVDIKPALRAKVDQLRESNRWTLNVTVETIIEAYFKKK